MGDAESAAMRLLSDLPHNSVIKARTQGYWAWAWIYAGRYAETEQKLSEAIPVIRERDPNALPTYLRHFGLAKCLQGRHEEGEALIVESIELTASRGPDFVEHWSTSVATLGLAFLRIRKFQRAEELLQQSLEVKQRIQDKLGIPEVLLWLGELRRLTKRNDEAQDNYRQSLEWTWMGRKYFEAAALAGVCQIHYHAGILSLHSPDLSRAENISHHFAYYDQLATLSMLRGRIAFEVGDSQAAINYFAHAAVHALRFNRFLLDEIIAQVIEILSKDAELGRELLQTLKRFWTGSATALAESPNALSGAVAPITLVEEERLARLREPGRGEPQLSVSQRLNER